MKRNLIIHFDVNETILLCDPAGGDDFHDCLNKSIAKSALIRVDQLAWHDYSPIDGATCPPLRFSFDRDENTISFYKSTFATEDTRKRFTETVGRGYRAVFEACLARLRLTEAEEARLDDRLVMRYVDGSGQSRAYHGMLPAFWVALEYLIVERKDQWSIVIRTFGSDAKTVVHALHAYFEQRRARGLTDSVILPVDANDTYRGRYVDGVFTLTHPVHGVLAEEDAVVNKLEGKGVDNSIVVVTDDYLHWKKGRYSPQCGKPMWLDASNTSHHIFFDDNIHNMAHNSIVAVRARQRAGEPFRPLTGEETLKLHGTHLIKVFAIDAIQNESFFKDWIKRIEQSFQLTVVSERDAGVNM